MLDSPRVSTERDARGRPKLAGVDTLASALAAITPGGVALTDTEQSAAIEAAGPPDEDGAIRIGVGRTDLGGMLQWEHPWCDPFRRLLVNPVVRPYLLTVLGSGYRMVCLPKRLLVSLRHKTIDLWTSCRSSYRFNALLNLLCRITHHR